MSKFWVSFLTVISGFVVLAIPARGQETRGLRVAGPGEMCGGIAGIMCATGLTCRYEQTLKMMPDATGICDAQSGEVMIYCDTGICPKGYTCIKPAPCPSGALCKSILSYCKRIVTTPVPERTCSSDSDCGSGGFCYQPPMPACPEGALCKMVMPAKVCRACVERPACLDGIVDEKGVVVYCMAKTGVEYCPKPKDRATEGEFCGGIAGIMCAEGLYCQHDSETDRVMADGMGICVKNFAKLCKQDADCGEGNYCSATPPGGCPTRIVNGVEEVSACAVLPRCWPKVTPTLKSLRMGDANKDSKVDLADFAVWKGEYLGKVNGLASDFDKNGKVDLADFSIWKSEYVGGKTAGIGEMCGGFAGILCAEGLECRYDVADRTKPDASGICDAPGGGHTN